MGALTGLKWSIFLRVYSTGIVNKNKRNLFISFPILIAFSVIISFENDTKQIACCTPDVRFPRKTQLSLRTSQGKQLLNKKSRQK